jgi:hypothetical protein
MEERRNWILRTPESFSNASDAAGMNRAFGVRETQVEGRQAESQAPKGGIISYYEQLQEAEATRQQPTTDAWLRREARSESVRVGPQGEASPRESWSLQPSLSDPSFYQRANQNAQFPTDPMRLQVNRDLEADSRFSRYRAQMHELIDPNRPAPLTSTPVNHRSGVAEILGGDPVASPVADLFVNTVDPITAYPDPTREALNPVVGTPNSSLAPVSGSPGLLVSSDPARRSGVAPSPLLRSMDEISMDVRPKSGAQAGHGSLNGPRTLQSIKVNLEMPGRSF